MRVMITDHDLRFDGSSGSSCQIWHFCSGLAWGPTKSAKVVKTTESYDSWYLKSFDTRVCKQSCWLSLSTRCLDLLWWYILSLNCLEVLSEY